MHPRQTLSQGTGSTRGLSSNLCRLFCQHRLGNICVSLISLTRIKGSYGSHPSPAFRNLAASQSSYFALGSICPGLGQCQQSLHGGHAIQHVYGTQHQHYACTTSTAEFRTGLLILCQTYFLLDLRIGVASSSLVFIHVCCPLCRGYGKLWDRAISAISLCYDKMLSTLRIGKERLLSLA